MTIEKKVIKNASSNKIFAKVLNSPKAMLNMLNQCIVLLKNTSLETEVIQTFLILWQMIKKSFIREYELTTEVWIKIVCILVYFVVSMDVIPDVMSRN